MRNNKPTIIIVLIALVLGISALLIGGTIAGWDILGWFSSRDAIWAYFLIFMFLLLVLGMFIRDWVNKR